MRKFHLLGLALFAVFAFSVVAASSAFAVSEWLVGGASAGLTLVDSEGTLLLEDTGTIAGASAVECSFLNEGWVGGDASGPNPTWDEVTKVTGLNEATEPLWIKCKVEKICEGNTVPEVMPVNLPWLTEILLVTEKFLDDLIGTGGNAGWMLKNCLVLAIPQEDECTAANASADLFALVGGEVLAEFSDAISPELATCTASSNLMTGVVVGDVLILIPNGESLGVS